MGTTRREFIKNGTAVVAGASLIGAAAPNVMFGIDTKTGVSMDLKYFLDHFGVSEEMIKTVMGEGLSKGGDYCDLYFQHSISNYAVLQDNAVSRAYSDVNYGVGIRVLDGDQTGYSFCEEISLDAMKSAARTAAGIAQASGSFKPVGIQEFVPKSYYPIKHKWEDVSIDTKIPYLQRLNEKIFAADKRMIKATISFSDETSYVMFANSEGRITYDYRPMGALSASCTAEQNGQKESAYDGVSGRWGREYLTNDLVDKLANDVVAKTTMLFEAVKPKGGELPVVLAAGGSGILLHEAIGHGMEADFNRKGISIFSDKMNKKVAHDEVTIVDNGTNENMRGSLDVDDEGNPVECTYMVEGGILRSYLHDRLSAKHYGVKMTGNGRRESFRHVPIPRMRNTYMLPGSHTKDDIIASVDYGIFCESFSNGQVMIGAGDFTFYVKTGYLIENGKLTTPIKDVNIIGNGPDSLSKIDMVGNDLEISHGTWTCGKSGQGVPVSQGLPTVKVASMTVGGVS